MRTRTFQILRRGVEAGVIAGIPQVLLAKVEERLFLPSKEDANLGPRFVQRISEAVRHPLREDEKWIAASAFHFGYAAFWGAAYALAYERRPVNPAVGGALLSALIYLITFPSWGGAVLTRAERPPERRSRRMSAVLLTAASTFGMCTALLYGSGPSRRKG